MDILLKGLLYAAVLGAQYVLSSQKNVYLGAVVPLLFSAGMTWRYVNVESVSTIQYLLITGFGLLCLVAEWGKGREVFRKKQEKELERMSIQDLK
ncbi:MULTISPECIES: hypothetical protein [unclassified Exiguobacterium]|uniref:hypothetical protein n=1 Tax=unclassified Exiguobacterium TaxID=2644629 RepID=UPI001BE85371|nr:MULTISPECIES: hypothetical protein [unclassified Exiguobacterium]